MKKKKKPIQVDIKALRKLLGALSISKKINPHTTAAATLALIFVIGIFASSPQLQNYFKSQPSEAGNALLPGGGSLGGGLVNGTGNLFGPYPWKPQGTLSLVSDYNTFMPAIDGDRIVYSKMIVYGNDDVYLYDSITGITTPICTDIFDQVRPRISNDYIVWIDSRKSGPIYSARDVYLYDINSAVEKNITNYYATSVYRVAISDNYVVFDVNYFGEVWGDIPNELKLYDINTDTTQTLFSFPGDEWVSRIEIDNDKIVVSFHGHSNIKLYDLATNQLTNVYPSIYDQGNADISGNTVVWSEKMDGHTYIYAYNLHIGNKETVYTFKKENNVISPSIDGDLVAWCLPYSAPGEGGVWIKKIFVLPFIINTIHLLDDQPDEFEMPNTVDISKSKIVWTTEYIFEPNYEKHKNFMFILNN